MILRPETLIRRGTRSFTNFFFVWRVEARWYYFFGQGGGIWPGRAGEGESARGTWALVSIANVASLFRSSSSLGTPAKNPEGWVSH